MGRRRVRGRDVNGILLLDKPSGITSNDALQQVKRLYFASKAGHTGSLDPLASGVLPICMGQATKVSAFLLDADKRYQVRCQLGVRTATADAEGEILETRAVENYPARQLEDVLDQFRGSIEQIPPMYSALKHEGQRLYKLARQGVEVERQARPVEIYQLTLTGRGPDWIDIEVHCSKGTYVRTLAEDIGEKLGCGAHVADGGRSLYRPATGYPGSSEGVERNRYARDGPAAAADRNCANSMAGCGIVRRCGVLPAAGAGGTGTARADQWMGTAVCR
jgi:tRNA pseudouridine55 synthase